MNMNVVKDTVNILNLPFDICLPIFIKFLQEQYNIEIETFGSLYVKKKNVCYIK